jgi:Mce-associated membrane protein
VSANRNPSPARSSLRVRPSGVNAAAVRRLAANHASAPATGQATHHATTVREPETPEAESLELESLEQESSEPESLEPESLELESPELDVTEEEDEAEDARRARLPWRMIMLVALAVVTLVLGGLAAWFGTEAGGLNGQSSAQNLALSDPGETGQVTSQVTSAIGALFSYSYANPAPTRQAASRLLTGAAVGQYATMIAEVKKDAEKDKLVVTTSVSNIGVEMLTANTGRLLVFATESDGSAGAATPTTAEAMLAVNAVLDGSTWKIEGIDTFAS